MPFLNTILELFFPVYCVGCNSSGKELCQNCIAEMPAAERESAEWIFPAFDYRHPPLKKALWLFKYKGKKNLAEEFAGVVYGKIMEELSELMIMENFRKPFLVPIPLSKNRHRERGYNQAELICRELLKLDTDKNFTFENNILIKSKNTEHQARIHNRAERLQNIVGSFTVKNPAGIKGRNIILIDDILTTGATLSEARKTLKHAGAKKIIAFTVAH